VLPDTTSYQQKFLSFFLFVVVVVVVVVVYNHVFIRLLGKEYILPCEGSAICTLVQMINIAKSATIYYILYRRGAGYIITNNFIFVDFSRLLAWGPSWLHTPYWC
jgi:hypothetical protein